MLQFVTCMEVSIHLHKTYFTIHGLFDHSSEDCYSSSRYHTSTSNFVDNSKSHPYCIMLTFGLSHV